MNTTKLTTFSSISTSRWVRDVGVGVVMVVVGWGCVVVGFCCGGGGDCGDDGGGGGAGGCCS